MTTLRYWKDLIIRCAETQQRPTLVFYERVAERPSLTDRDSLKIESWDLRDLERAGEKGDRETSGALVGGHAWSEAEIKYQQAILDQFKK